MNQRPLNPKMVRVAERLAGRILRLQTGIAVQLNRKVQHWNRASKLMALALFILLFGGVSLWLLIKSIY